jgi:hypothetical protein
LARERRPPSEKASWIRGTKSLSFSSANEIISRVVESLRQPFEDTIIHDSPAKPVGRVNGAR